MLIDRATIFVRSGKGGDGAVSFRREKYIPKGGPNGGDGGKGGDVRLVAKAGVDTLLDLTGRHHWFAENGQPGGIKQRIGKDGADLDVLVPPGTLVYNDETGELIVDMDTPDKEYIVAKGGKGGFGNEHFKSATNQTPRESTPGEPSEEYRLRLELKLIADIGLIGKPNAGKSTLLSVLSKAKPKIADYPFTTLEPNLGIAELEGNFGGRRLIFADIPGLIEGASDGHGLGFEFLRHVERTRLLVHVVEIDATDGSDPAENYKTIRRELEAHSKTLAQKPEIVILSKIELLGTHEDCATAVALLQDAIGCDVLPISSVTGDGLTDLLELCWKRVQGAKQAEQAQGDAATPSNQATST